MPQPPAEFTIITADRLIDGLGGPPIPNGGVMIHDGKIVRVGAGDELRAPDGATVERHHRAGTSIVPGYVDAHTHVIAPGDGTPGEGVAATDDDILLLQAAANVRRMLNLGVTTARENGAKNRVGFSIREGIRRGIVPGPRMVICGRPVATTGGHLHFFGQAADGEDGVRRAVRELIRDGADWIKITATGGSTKSSDPWRPSFRVAELSAIVDEAHRRGKLTGAHTTASKGVEGVLEAGVDMIIHCVFWEPDGSYRYRPDLIDRAVADGRWINPTLYGGAYTEIEGIEGKHARDGHLSPADEAELAQAHATVEMLMDGVRRMISQGAKITAGSDTAWRWGRAGGLAREVELLGKSGLSNAQAIVSGTSGAAESIGAGDVAGRIAEGRPADLVVVEGDALADLAALQHVVDVWLAGHRLERTA
ncbi:MAG TPA: amidohydrolase family protein [Candidatus Saccharimonadales bacterium]|nr:amidohydrolase family protein [Candidatus Saccharimonadales bacterium]